MIWWLRTQKRTVIGNDNVDICIVISTAQNIFIQMIIHPYSHHLWNVIMMCNQLAKHHHVHNLWVTPGVFCLKQTLYIKSELNKWDTCEENHWGLKLTVSFTHNEAMHNSEDCRPQWQGGSAWALEWEIPSFKFLKLI